MERKKLIIVGIDGGTFNIINPLFKRKMLHNMKKFKYKSVLKSTIPPGTAVSWASFSTGKSPGKTGIYDFTIVEENSWNINLVNRKKLKEKTLWNTLDKTGLKSIFINIPITYPAEKINGVMISGIDAPSKFSDYVYPKELKNKLNEFDYEIEASALKEEHDIVDDAMNILDKRIITARYFLENEEFNFFIVLFRATDVVQHFAWGMPKIEQAYKKIDEFIGEIGEYLKKNKGDLIVISDHGSEKVDKAFNTNAWLEKEGYLKTNLRNESFISLLGFNRENIFKIIRRLKLDFLIKMIPRNIGKKIPTKKINFEEAILTGIIDLNQTKAISKRAVKTSQIFLNKKSRRGIIGASEEKKLKEEILNKLKSFFEEQKLSTEIKTKEELYGKDAVSAPDITLYFKEKGYDVLDSFSKEKKIWDIPQEKATHNTEGIIFSNLDLKLNGAKIIDMTPTILRYFGISPKEKFDGKSLI